MTHQKQPLQIVGISHQLVDFTFTKNSELPHQIKCRFVAVLARQLMKYDNDLSLGDAMRYAWDYMRYNINKVRLIKATSAKGKVYQRIVMADHWSNHYEVKGTGRPLKEGQILFANAACLECGCKNVLMSTYEERIIELI